jgi:hypothetical protein
MANRVPYTILIVVLTLACLAGIYLVGRGISGFVVSESCCFGPKCSYENVCDFARPNLESPAEVSRNASDIYFGFAIICVCIMAAVIMAHPEILGLRRLKKDRHGRHK